MRTAVPETDYSVESSSPETEFYYQWSLEVRKQNMTFTNEVLRNLLAISATLLGGGIAFLNDDMMNSAFRAIATVMFAAALFLSFLGVMPCDFRASPDQPSVFRLGQEKAFAWKSRLLGLAGGFIVFGFAAALIGMMLRLTGIA